MSAGEDAADQRSLAVATASESADDEELTTTTATEDGGSNCHEAESVEALVACVREHMLQSLRHMSSTQALLFTGLYVLISLWGMLGNGLVMVIVARRRHMRTTRNVFIVNLALSNFLLALILVPFLWLPTYRIEFPYGAFACKLAQAFPSTNIICSTLTVGVIAVDRYYAIVHTRFRAGSIKTAEATCVALGVWAAAFALSVPYFLHFDTFNYSLPSRLLPQEVRDKHAGALPEQLPLFQRCILMPKACAAATATAAAKPPTPANEIPNGNLSQVAQYNNKDNNKDNNNNHNDENSSNNREQDDDDDDDDEKREQRTQNCLKFYDAIVTATTAAFIYFVPMTVLLVFSFLLTRFLAKNERQHSLLRSRRPYPPSPIIGRTAAAATTAATATATAVTAARTSMTARTSMATNMGGVLGRRRSRTTALLFAMAFSNAVVWLPFIAVTMFIQLAPVDVTRPIDYFLRQLDDAAKLISMLSICVHPLLYGYLNTNFNLEFKAAFRTCFPCLR